MSNPTRRPWHLWAAAIVMFGVFAGGARDFWLILVGDTGYTIGQFGQSGVEYFATYPAALRVLWALVIAAGLLGPVLLVALSRWTVPVAQVAAVGQVVLMGVTFLVRDRWNALGPETAAWDVLFAVIAALFAWYCTATMRRTHVKRADPSRAR